MISPDRIILERCIALRHVRFLALTLLALATGVVAFWLMNELVDEFEYWDGIDYIEGLCLSVGVLTPGFLILLLQRRVTRWLVPKPRDECYDCGYLLNGMKPERCPECGATLYPAASVGPASNGTGP